MFGLSTDGILDLLRNLGTVGIPLFAVIIWILAGIQSSSDSDAIANARRFTVPFRRSTSVYDWWEQRGPPTKDGSS